MSLNNGMFGTASTIICADIYQLLLMGGNSILSSSAFMFPSEIFHPVHAAIARVY